MPPTIHLNVAKFGEGIHDPFLTDEGVEQARELCRNFSHHDEIDILMASPMKRTIQTCQLVFRPEIDRGVKILLMPLAQEVSDNLMDTGSSEAEIRQAFGDLIDTTRVEVFPYWATNSGRFAIEGDAVIERARLLRRVLRDRPEGNIALVSHGSFAHYLVGNVDKAGEAQTTRMWANTECRTYYFPSEEDEDAQMRETEASRGKRPDLEKECVGYVISPNGHRKNSIGEAISP